MELEKRTQKNNCQGRTVKPDSMLLLEHSTCRWEATHTHRKPNSP